MLADLLLQSGVKLMIECQISAELRIAVQAVLLICCTSAAADNKRIHVRGDVVIPIGEVRDADDSSSHFVDGTLQDLMVSQVTFVSEVEVHEREERIAKAVLTNT